MNTDIDFVRPSIAPTYRPTNLPMEQLIASGPVTLLDHGFLRVVDYMGDQQAIVDMARTSYMRGTSWTSTDRGLIRRLMRLWHTSPFEGVEIKLHVKLPIFVARQWIRHRMASLNEQSARYSILDKEFYIPTIEALAPQSLKDKQGRDGVLTERQAQLVRRMLMDDAERSYHSYEVMLAEKGTRDRLKEEAEIVHGDDAPTPHNALLADETFPGIARELARMDLSLNFYTQWYWKTDGKNLLDFLRLRADSHAQYEIRVYAEEIERIVAAWMPDVFEAYLHYRKNAANLSGPAIRALRDTLSHMDGGQHLFTKYLAEQGIAGTELGEVLDAVFGKVA